ncbi:hypothetical protein N7537_012011 [Penicillium hordei]|uniref:Uncharacterized protein n=1 Tax=Penicillium hordei TaxID=40994 RepID=A0AAD6GTA6_9EURO|nr:uncharacterized protein N7537_012011 [Penicillium hordei]KAJ5589333.1 hypothetical protein N7537_012011 [Penicillium hordei]
MACSDDFSSGSMAQWRTPGGSSDASSNHQGPVNTNFGNSIFDADITPPSTSGNAGLLFRVFNRSIGANAYKGYYAGLDATGSAFLGRASKSWMQLGRWPADVASNNTHHVKVQAIDRALELFIDDMSKAKISLTDDTYTSGVNGVQVYDTGATFESIEIAPLVVSGDF